MSDTTESQQFAALPLLAKLSGEAKGQVAEVFLKVSEAIDLDDGEELIHEGHLGFETGYILTEGTAEVIKGGKIVSELTAPALLGEMSQFKSCDTRTATVRAKGPCVAYEFHWDEFYEQAREDLPEDVHASLLAAIEELVWDRFGIESILTLPLFKGLSNPVRLKACIVFPWITDLEIFKEGEEIFRTLGRCQSKGHLLISGAVRIIKQNVTDKQVKAPGLLGVMPKHDASLRWSATAIAQGDVELFTFSWQTYTKKLEERLTRDERRQLVESIKNNGKSHFWR